MNSDHKPSIAKMKERSGKVHTGGPGINNDVGTAKQQLKTLGNDAEEGLFLFAAVPILAGGTAFWYLTSRMNSGIGWGIVGGIVASGLATPLGAFLGAKTATRSL